VRSWARCRLQFCVPCFNTCDDSACVPPRCRSPGGGGSDIAKPRAVPASAAAAGEGKSSLGEGGGKEPEPVTAARGGGEGEGRPLGPRDDGARARDSKVAEVGDADRGGGGGAKPSGDREREREPAGGGSGGGGGRVVVVSPSLLRSILDRALALKTPLAVIARLKESNSRGQTWYVRPAAACVHAVRALVCGRAVHDACER
jgi:hypothetical protein